MANNNKKSVTAAPAAANSKADQRKSTLAAAEKIGTASSVKDKFAAIIATRDGSNGIRKSLFAAAATAHKSRLTANDLKAAGISPDEIEEYTFRVTCLYQAAARMADVVHGGSAQAVKAARNALFTEWKSYVTLLNNGAALKSAGADEILLTRAVTRTIKAGESFEVYQRKDGETGARIASGTASAAIVSLSAFQKELERIAVDRLLGFDGVVSYNEGKAISAANKSARDAAIADAAPVSVEPAPAADQPAA